MNDTPASNHAPPSPERAAIGRAVCAALAANPRAQRLPAPGVDVFVVAAFLPPLECTRLRAVIDADARPSRVFRGDPGHRTSHTCHFDPAAVRDLDQRLSRLTGIPAACGEPLQGQRYAPGQYYRPHYDWFFEDDLWPEIRKGGGHRTFTAMAYLSEVQGGGTFFPRLGMRISPKPGALLIWNNMNADGSFNELTLHEGETVSAGTKYVLTKWYREHRI